MFSECRLLIFYVVLAVQKVIIIILNASDLELAVCTPGIPRTAEELNIYLCHFYY